MPARFELARFVALVAGEPDDRLDRDVHRRVEAVEQHRVVVRALDQTGLRQHRRDRRGELALHPDRGALEVGEFGRAPGLTISASIAGAALDREGDEIGVVGARRTSTTSLNDPPDENWASLAAMSG